VAHLVPTVSWLLLQALFITILSDKPSHSPSPAGFVYLRFFWRLAPFLFSSVWPYEPVAIVVLVYLLFTWGSAFPPLSGRVCLMSVTVGSLPLNKHAGVGYATLASSGRLVYLEFKWGSAPPPLLGRVCYTRKCPSPFLQSSGHPTIFAMCPFFSIACLLFSFFLF
jgi:hypothetical protein